MYVCPTILPYMQCVTMGGQLQIFGIVFTKTNNINKGLKNLWQYASRAQTGYTLVITNNSAEIIRSKPWVHNYTLNYYPYPVQ